MPSMSGRTLAERIKAKIILRLSYLTPVKRQFLNRRLSHANRRAVDPIRSSDGSMFLTHETAHIRALEQNHAFIVHRANLVLFRSSLES